MSMVRYSAPVRMEVSRDAAVWSCDNATIVAGLRDAMDGKTVYVREIFQDMHYLPNSSGPTSAPTAIGMQYAGPARVLTVGTIPAPSAPTK